MDTKSLHIRITEIDREANALARSIGCGVKDITQNPTDKPVEILEPLYDLLTEKLKIQKLLFQMQGNDLSNVAFLKESSAS